MKTHIHTYVTSCISIILLLLAISCNKSESNLISQQVTKPNPKSAQAPELLNWTPVKDSVYKMIRRMRHWDTLYRENRFPGNLSSIPAEHAIWMLQSNANFDYAKFNDSLLADVINDFSVDLRITSIQGDSLYIAPADLASVYSVIEDSLLANQQRQEVIQMVIFDIGEITSANINVIVQIVTSSWHGHIPILPENTDPDPFTSGTYQTLQLPLGAPLTQLYLPTEIEKRLSPITLLGGQEYAQPMDYFYVPVLYSFSLVPWVPWLTTSNTGYDLGTIWGGNGTEYKTASQSNDYLEGAWDYANYHRDSYPGLVLWKVGVNPIPAFGPNLPYTHAHLYYCTFAKLIPFNHSI
jgi:hypothetical protein